MQTDSEGSWQVSALHNRHSNLAWKGDTVVHTELKRTCPRSRKDNSVPTDVLHATAKSKRLVQS